MQVCDRLKAAREALGLSQQGMAEIGGVSLRSQQNYEAGLRNPDSAYLTAIAAAGVDVLYVLTGQRSNAASTPHLPPANPRVQALVDNYEAADEAGKRVIEGAADLAAKSAGRVKKAG